LAAYGLYEKASALLRATPCDVEAAEDAVARFVAYCSGSVADSGTEGTDGTDASADEEGTP
jgi:hypothetical protein